MRTVAFYLLIVLVFLLGASLIFKDNPPCREGERKVYSYSEPIWNGQERITTDFYKCERE